jgi:hypothetical protein
MLVLVPGFSREIASRSTGGATRDAPTKLLLAVRGVVERVNVQRDVIWNFIKGLDEQIHQNIARPPKIGNRHGVLEA